MYQVESVESWRSTLQKKELWVFGGQSHTSTTTTHISLLPKRLLQLLVKVSRSKPSLHEYEPIVQSCIFRSQRADLKPESEVHRWHQLICIESHNRSCRRARDKWCNSQLDTIRRCLYVQELNGLIESRLSIHVLRWFWVLRAEAHASGLNRQSGVVHLALSVGARNAAE